MNRAAFELLRQGTETTTETPFRNARNAVAGSLKLLDPGVVARRRLEFVCWGLGHVEGLVAETYEDTRKALSAFGFTMAKPFEIVDSIDGVVDFHGRIEAQRENIEYELDGVVAKINRLDLQRQLGRTARTPRWMLAYKFAARRTDTVVLDILSQVGRTGAITPVAELDPVELAGFPSATKGPVFDLPTTMSKLLNLGMTLEDVVRCVTTNPARVIGEHGQIGTLKPGAIADVAVLSLEHGEFDFVDTDQNHMIGEQKLVAHLTIKDGRIWYQADRVR